jgi:hypothetical protein
MEAAGKSLSTKPAVARDTPLAGARRRRTDDHRDADGQHPHRRPLVTRLRIFIYQDERLVLRAARE